MDDNPVDKVLFYQRIQKVRDRVLAVVCVLAIALAGYSLYLLHRVNQSEQRIECITREDRIFFDGVAKSFLSPPAPNPARSEAVRIIEQASKQFESAAACK